MKKIISLLTVPTGLLAAASAHALNLPVPPTSVDEPSIFGLLAVGAVAGVLTWRARKKR